MSTAALDPIVLEALGRMAKEGSIKASASMSKLIGQTTAVESFAVRRAMVEEIAQTVGKPEDQITAIVLDMSGDAFGSMLLIFPETSAKNIADLLQKRPLGSTHTLTDPDISALKETGNIIAGSFLAAISNFLDLNIIESVPRISSDMLKAVIDSVLASFLEQRLEEAFVFEIQFSMGTNEGMATQHVPEIKINTHFVLLLDSKSVDKIKGILKEHPWGERR
jgi:chemotaxis protein CheC